MNICFDAQGKSVHGGRRGYLILAALLFLILFVGNIPPVESAGVNTERVSNILPQFHAYAEKTFNRSGVPGVAIAIVTGDTIPYIKCFGVKKSGSSDPVDAETVFQLASISKAFTATTLASLVGDGLLSWDDRVIDHFPDFRLYDPWVTDQMTIRDLMSHRSGLPEHTGDVLQNGFGYTRKDILYRLRYQKPVTGFRTTFGYQNYLITVAAETASRAMGEQWPDLISKRIFKPLGMTSASSRFDDFEKRQNRISTHTPVNGRMTPHELFNDDACSPAGGVSASINDMVKWTRMLLNGGEFEGKRIIAAEALEETRKPHTIKGSSTGEIACYGLGWFVTQAEGRMTVSHGGDFESGVSTIVSMVPSEKVGIIILTNAFQEGHILHAALTKVFYELYFTGKSETDWWPVIKEKFKKAIAGSILDPFEHLPKKPPHKSSGLPKSSYVGEYANSYYGTIKITSKGKDLNLYLGNKKVLRILTHWSGNIYKDEETNSGVIFAIGSDNKAFEVLVKCLDFNGRNGRFIRRQ